MFENKITFCCINENLVKVWPHPKPSTRFIPDEYKNQISSHLSMLEVRQYLDIDVQYPNAFREWIKWMKRMDKYREQNFKTTFPKLYDIIKKDWDSVTDLVDPKPEFDIFKIDI